MDGWIFIVSMHIWFIEVKQLYFEGTQIKNLSAIYKSYASQTRAHKQTHSQTCLLTLDTEGNYFVSQNFSISALDGAGVDTTVF